MSLKFEGLNEAPDSNSVVLGRKWGQGTMLSISNKLPNNASPFPAKSTATSDLRVTQQKGPPMPAGTAVAAEVGAGAAEGTPLLTVRHRRCHRAMHRVAFQLRLRGEDSSRSRQDHVILA